MSDELHRAIGAHDLDGIAALLTAGHDPNALDVAEPRWSPLHAAIEELEHGGDLEALALLLRRGAAVDAWDAHRDSTPLLMATFRRQREAALLLLAAGASPNVVGGEGDTPLSWCAQGGDLRMAAALLRCGAVATIDHSGGPTGMSALGHAAHHLDIDMIKLLISGGASVGACDVDGRTARDRMPPRTEGVEDRFDLAERLLLTPPI